jgi:NADH-quinone oxidoreductase subunit B
LGIERIFGDSVITTSVQAVANWARKNALWPMPFGTACCAIEMMATLSGRYDMIVSGRVSIKMMPVLLKIWEQMPEPKWCISMGACASSGGVFDTYTLIQGVDQFLPVNVYIPGCPPRPESLLDALLKIQEIVHGPLAGAGVTPAAAPEPVKGST